MTIEPITATVTKTGLGGTRASNRGWRVQLPDGTMLWAAIHARVRTLKIPTLQVGDVIFSLQTPSPFASDTGRI